MTNQEVTVIRNLNEARRDMTIFKWSIAECNGNSRGKTIANVDELTLTNVRVGFSQYKFNSTQSGSQKRAVYIWLIGEIVEDSTYWDEAIFDNGLARFSCNPKRGEKSFTFCQSGELVDFNKVRAVRLNSTGAYAIGI